MKSAPCLRCRRPILLVQLAPEGAMPVEPVPDSDGTVSARPFGDGLVGWVVSRERPHQPGYRRYMVHAAMCPLNGRPRRPTAPQPTLFD